MFKDNILVIGALSPLGIELTRSLRDLYGINYVIAADIRKADVIVSGNGPYEQLDVCQPIPLAYIIRSHRITQIYLIDSRFPGIGEKDPRSVWDFQMQSLLNVLEVARELRVKKIFWPGSIAVFNQPFSNNYCMQHTIAEPSTMYGISKLAGEHWCQWYYYKHALDIRSLRLPGLITNTPSGSGEISDYAVEMFHAAIRRGHYNCFLQESVRLPMLYFPDAVRGIRLLMEAPAANISIRKSYNISGISFSPGELATCIQQYHKEFKVHYDPDYRQGIAESWPQVINDEAARLDFGWQPEYDLDKMTASMLNQLQLIYPSEMAE